jgi:hypothetical protein
MQVDPSSVLSLALKLDQASLEARLDQAVLDYCIPSTPDYSSSSQLGGHGSQRRGRT